MHLTLMKPNVTRASKAFLFVRHVSPGDFVDQAFAGNLRDFHAFCERRSLIAGQTFREFGSSTAFLEHRPILQEAIAAASNNILVVERLDKLSNSASVIAAIFEECAAANVRLEPIFGPRTLQTANLIHTVHSPWLNEEFEYS